MFAQPDSSGENKILDRQTLKSIGAYPNFYEEEETKIAPSTLPAAPSPPTPLPLIEDQLAAPAVSRDRKTIGKIIIQNKITV